MRRLLVLLTLTAALFAAAFVAAACAAGDPPSPARPSSSASSIEKAQNGKQKCVKGCQTNHRDAVKLCNTLYPPKHRIEDHRNCLDKARSTFDACLATCQ